MNKEDFTFLLADYFMRILKEKGREMKFSDLEEWARREILSKMPENDDRLFDYYTNSAKDILKELGLVKSEGKMIVVSLEARTLSEPISVRGILYQKKKKEESDEIIKKRYYYANIAAVIIPPVVALLPYFLNLGDIEQIIGWFLAGSSFGYFVNELINKR